MAAIDGDFNELVTNLMSDKDKESVIAAGIVDQEFFFSGKTSRSVENVLKSRMYW